MSEVYTADVVRPQPFIDWRAIIGGALIAAGVSFTLLAFGSGIGLSVVSTAPTWRDSSPWLWLLSGLFLIFVALCSFGFGGYAVGRMGFPARLAAGVESKFRDGMHGTLRVGFRSLDLGCARIAGSGRSVARDSAVGRSGRSRRFGCRREHTGLRAR